MRNDTLDDLPLSSDPGAALLLRKALLRPLQAQTSTTSDPVKLSRLVIAPAFLIILQTPSCNPYACVYETRFVLISGAVQSTNGSVTVDFVSYRQYRPDQSIPNSVGYNAHGEALAAAPTALLLRDARDGTTIQTLNVSTSTTSFAAGSAFVVPDNDSDRIFQLLASGNVQLVVQLANDASIVVPLAVTTQEDWHRPNCS
jgi:hypothetical protein